MSLTTQFVTMAAMIISGIYLGASLETFRRFEVYWRKNGFLYYAMEISFWLLQTLILFYVLFLVNQGELRFYILLATLCGFAMYQSLLASIYRRILERIILTFKTIYLIFYKLVQALVFKPLKLILQLLLAICLLVGRTFYSVVQLLFRIIYWPVSLVGKGCWRLLPKNAQKYFVSLAGFYSKIENNIINRVKNNRNKRR